MLKIKDNIDLKELEKFGFKPLYNEYNGKLIEYNLRGMYSEERGTSIKIKKKFHFLSFIKKNHTSEGNSVVWGLVYYTHKDLSVDYYMHKKYTSGGGRSCYLMEVIFDLIQAGLVEKVDD